MRNRSIVNYHYTSVCLALLLLFIQPIDSSFTLSIETGSSECFSIRVPSDAKSVVSGSYELLDEDETGTTVQVLLKEENTHNVQWTSSQGRDEDSWRFVTDPGKRYSLCFISLPSANNRMVQNRGRGGGNNRRPRLQEEEEEREFGGEDWQQGENMQEAAVETDDYAAGRIASVTHVGFSLRYASLPRSLDNGEAGPEALRAIQMVEEAAYIHQDWQNLLDHFDFLRHREGVHYGMLNSIHKRLFRWTLIEAILVVLMAVIQVVYWRKFFEQRRFL